MTDNANKEEKEQLLTPAELAKAIAKAERKKEQLRRKMRHQEMRQKLRRQVIAREIMIGEEGRPLPRLKEVVAFDLECAGFVEDDIIEIGAMKINLRDGSTKEFHELVHPRTHLNKHVVKMTGITEDDLKDCDDIAAVLPRFIAFVGKCPVLGHSIGDNDIVRINLALRRAGIAGMRGFFPRYIDTERIAHRMFDGKRPEIKNFGLTSLLEQYDIKLEDTHRAIDDALAAFMLYKKLTEELMCTSNQKIK
ncbi:MAG: 3'-5' exonuclease [Schwartzia sp.]|nr:3'-5' exonuclease [Schwartzia sp. (in: firmicutes)]